MSAATGDAFSRLLQVSPPEKLSFRRDKSQGNVTQSLNIRNVASKRIAFKVKTTQPKSYLVRPSSDTLEPNTATDVTIILNQPSGDDSAAPVSAHRFLIQAVELLDSETSVDKTAWTTFDKARIKETRLCVELLEGDEPSPQVEEKSANPADSGPVHSSSSDRGPAQDADIIEKLKQEKQTLEKQLRDVGKADGYTIVHLIFALLIAFLAGQVLVLASSSTVVPLKEL
mmetsp:Transcript_35800/g.57035  ORF Transcript_35800/g.57035 Transcript_35800/m.57035 type:complete len:228 (+) Transcript_35800:46-729(+)|eukprot:CAMPEP_0169081776 /NCGR_PEP_ID=MMETSP1015-20121227/11190_1 /TAXON_ID=342587 /ORGANISM="Karlodinium micrum, Strain CCMP2283" /LENGTH=227 /DNA_ID=CAMNT_0009141585 /DNA_START=46 /DNA_END=729 /DNA_ORIENTATION=+